MLAFLEEEKEGFFFEQEFAKEEGDKKGRRPRPKGVTMKVNQVKVKILRKGNALEFEHSCLYDSFVFRC